MTTPFAGIRTFLKAPYRREHPERDFPYTIVGVPFDETVTFRNGARMAPAAIREASLMLTDGHHPTLNVDPVDMSLVCDAGDVLVPVHDTETAYQYIETCLDMFDHPIVLGGDHSVTLAALRSRFKRHGEMALVQFDAHCDTWDGAHNHGTFVRQAIEEGLIVPEHIVQIGIRSPVPNHVQSWSDDQGIGRYSAECLLDGSMDMHDILTEVLIAMGDLPVYMTFDIDCVDPSQAPGTGTPEPAGLWSWQALRLVQDITRSDKNIVGFDVMEVCPPYDNPSQQTSVLAANLVWTYLCSQASKVNV